MPAISSSTATGQAMNAAMSKITFEIGFVSDQTLRFHYVQVSFPLDFMMFYIIMQKPGGILNLAMPATVKTSCEFMNLNFNINASSCDKIYGFFYQKIIF
jgi:hypothetical protein